MIYVAFIVRKLVEYFLIVYICRNYSSLWQQKEKSSLAGRF